MDKKQLLEKIKQLIDSQEAANNLLALMFLHTQLNQPFIEAFRQLTFLPMDYKDLVNSSRYAHLYQIPIGKYDVIFVMNHSWHSTQGYPYIRIERQVKHQQEALPTYQKDFFINFFESENERDLYEAMIGLPNLGEGLENLFF